ncbi:hypothetical protein THAOC_28121 [Thalassiosira oceanica]|uniref:Neuroguidin n=1 Tax=Thalassiosira oceanica TaxID=159749 RepID=K0RUQ7_THAOC|nr:hypothetical protein THAOC_28121 [Thalassiosira oceanica]|eukprot:EJK52586.1 hypothetical protein THAOC_28121 [Thalassiosira oceanica]
MESSDKKLLSTLGKINGTTVPSLRRSIEHHVDNKEYSSRKDGLNYLSVKNSVLLSYLIDLTMLLKLRMESNADNEREDGSDDEDNDATEQCIERLRTMKTAIEKMRPLEKRMRYQIDKLLALSTLGAETFAGREKTEESLKSTVSIDDTGKKGDDPLSFKPDLKGMMKMFEVDDGGDGEQDDGDGEGLDDAYESDVEEEDDTNRPSVSLEKEESKVYQPPRLQSTPFEETRPDDRRSDRRLNDRLANSELTEAIRAQYTDAPEEEDARGGAMLGRQSEAARRIAARDADIKEFEETQMIRLTMSRDEKKKRRKMMRGELSNLGSIAGLGNIVGSVEDSFGERNRGNEDEGSNHKVKGMRKRRVESLERRDSKKRGSKKKKGSMNSLQRGLYGK